jgi:hypothetical protein
MGRGALSQDAAGLRIWSGLNRFCERIVRVSTARDVKTVTSCVGPAIMRYISITSRRFIIKRTQTQQDILHQ